MSKWICQKCGRELESEVEPKQCPCGSEDIEHEEKKSRLEQLLENWLS